MRRDEEQNDETGAEEPQSIERPEEIVDPSLPGGSAETAESEEGAEATGRERSLGDGLWALREEAAAVAGEEAVDAHGADASAAETAIDDAGPSVSQVLPGVESISASASLAAEAGDDTAPPPNLSFFGPITRLDDLPQHDIEHLDEETAANLHAAIKNPEKFEPGYLDPTTIRDLYSTMPRMRGEGGDDEAPWYHSPLPPVRLEVVLLKYDGLVDKAIERAAGRIDQVTDSKIDGKINSAKFEIRCDIRSLLR
jgi:hypothetical protein